ncbi:MAG: hypothetical protein E7310_03875 [Clostridiales bacterium]|nr:hypothetical protein [Clostridiales bacterium]
MLKKTRIILITIILLILFSTTVMSTELKTKLEVVQKESEVKYLENNQGYISKTITDVNEENGEVTVEVKLANLAKDINVETETYENTEIIIIIPEILSISENADKLKQYIEYIEIFATKIFEKNSKTKIAIVGMKGPVSDSYINDQGKIVYGENNEGTKAGSIDNAEVVVSFTNDIENIKNGIKNMNGTKTKYYNNLQAAIKIASSTFSNNANKILISLYDTVPSVSIGQCSQITWGGSTGFSTGKEAIIAKNEKIVKTTKEEILSLKKSNIDFILLRPKDTDFNQKWYDVSTGELMLDFDGSEYVKNLYGTMENPTYGKMYSLNEDSLQQIVTEKIYEDVMEKVRNPIDSAKLIDYFPADIIENFEFECVDKPNIGIVSAKIDKQNNSILWDIGTLSGNTTAILKYKLKLKNMSNSELINKTIATNEKIELTYKNSEQKDCSAVLESSPKIKLIEIKEDLIATVSYNPTSNTTETVEATIKTNKPVKSVEGWTQSEDRMILTKTYSTNIKETVLLIDDDDMERRVEININNIVKENTSKDDDNNNTNNISDSNDKTTSNVILPDTGKGFLIIGVMFLSGWTIYVHKRNKKFKGI